MKGQWVGTWKMSSDVEKLLQRMITPNADLRCTAAEALEDIYWSQTPSDRVVTNSKLLVQFRFQCWCLPSILTGRPGSVSQLRPVSMLDNFKVSESLPSLKSQASKDVAHTPRSKQEKAKVRVLADKENISGPPGLAREKSRSASALGAVLPRHKHAQPQPVSPAAERKCTTNYSM